VALGVLVAVLGPGCAGPEAIEPPNLPPEPPVIELEVWEVWDPQAEVARALAPFEDRPVPIPPDQRERWTRSGLRAISVPEDELDDLRASLDTIGPRVRQSIAPAALWTTVARGPAWRGPRALLVEDGPIALKGGALTLMLRAWTSPPTDPARTPRPTIRSEFAVLHTPTRNLPSSMPLGERRRPASPLEQGFLLRSLSTTAMLSRGDALVLCAASPQDDWSRWLETESEEDGERPDEDADADDTGEGEEETEAAPSPAGPAPPALLTTGEALLSDWVRPNPRGVKALVVLVARPPDSYRLRKP